MVSHDSFFNSISPPPLSVIDNWCGLTSLSEDVEFLTENHRVACYCCAFILDVRLAVFSLLSQVMTWHWRDPQGARAPREKNPKNPIGCFSHLKCCPMPKTVASCPVPLSIASMPLSLWNYAALDGYFVFMTLFLTEEQIVRLCCGLALVSSSVFSSKLRAVQIGFRDLFCITLPEEKYKQALFFFFFTSIDCSSSPECQFIQTPNVHMWFLSHTDILH